MSNVQRIHFGPRIDPGDVRSGKRGAGALAPAAARAVEIRMITTMPGD